MGFSYLTNLPLEQARRDYLSLLTERGFAPRTEMVPVQSACGRVTAGAVYARICAPHYPACAMDGLAVTAADTFGASETTPVRLGPGRYELVDTGDPLPAGRDAVVMVEDVVWKGDEALLREAAAPWQHVRQIGEDVCAGEMLLPARTAVSPAAIGAMIAGGVLEVEVLARPVVGIIPTGDEVVPPTPDPAPGDVMEFNSAIFSAMLTQWGALPRTYPIVRDVEADIRAALERDRPVAFLNLCNGKVKELDWWHWVTIVALEGSAATILDSGREFPIDLERWLATTRKRGGVVTVT